MTEDCISFVYWDGNYVFNKILFHLNQFFSHMVVIMKRFKTENTSYVTWVYNCKAIFTLITKTSIKLYRGIICLIISYLFCVKLVCDGYFGVRNRFYSKLLVFSADFFFIKLYELRKRKKKAWYSIFM